MPRRSRATLLDVTDLGRMAGAFHRAARGRRHRPDVREFERDLWDRLGRLQRGVLDDTVPLGRMTAFVIHDPKRRTIHAPVFEERVLHHAVMDVVGPVLDRSLGHDAYACRVGKGALAAVGRAQAHSRRFPWVVKADVRRYFASIDRERLVSRLTRKFKDRGLLRLLARIISTAPSAAVEGAPPGRGLPIGALTSQHFANFYLAPLDAHLLEHVRVAGVVRYMDDVVWWCRTRAEARSSLAAARDFAAERLALELKPSATIQRSRFGVTMCGFRVHPHRLGLTRRRRRRYRAARARAEAAYGAGSIDALELQRDYDAARAVTAHARASGVRRADLHLRPPPEA